MSVEIMMPTSSVLAQAKKDSPSKSQEGGASFASYLKESAEPLKKAEKLATEGLTSPKNIDLEAVANAVIEAEMQLKLMKTTLEKGAAAFKEVTNMQL